MKPQLTWTLCGAALCLLVSVATALGAFDHLKHASASTTFAVHHTDAEWKKLLPAESYSVLRQAGTEPAFHNKYWDFHGKGTFACAACGKKLFSSDTKFDSHTGWPSFYQEITPGATLIKSDDSFGMEREEVICSRCGSHLGHVFDDGPQPTGLRYCMNSAALKLTQP